MEEGLWALEGCPLLLQGTAAPALCHELPDLCSVTQFHWLLAMHWEVLKTYVLSFAVYGVLFFFLLYSLLIIMARFILSFFWKCLWISKTAKAAGEKAGESTKGSILDQSTALDFSSASLPSSQWDFKVLYSDSTRKLQRSSCNARLNVTGTQMPPTESWLCTTKLQPCSGTHV